MISTKFATISATLLLSIVSASAATVTASLGGVACAQPNAGLCSAVAGATTVTFDEAGVLGSSLPYVSGIATYTEAGNTGSPFVQGNVSGQFANPVNDTTTYLTVGSPSRPNPVTIDFSLDIKYFGLYLGSPDDYNTVAFYKDGLEIASFGGDDLIPPGQGNQAVSQFVNFTVNGGSVDQIVLTSSQAAMETDNHAFVPTPEPGTFVLLGAGLAGVGFFSRRRKSA